MVKANGMNNSPTMPPTKISGANTATVTNVEERIGLNISIVASRIKARPRSFSSFRYIRRYIFSTTTMESSMTRPIATVMAPSVIMFRVISSQCKISKAVKIETGIEIIEIIVDLKFLKNKKMMITANNPPNKAFSTMEYTDSSIGLP